jgi:pyruvate-formate lyase
MAERKRKDLMDQLELKPDKAWIADEMIPLLDKVNLYDGMIMAGKAMILWAKRYSRLCKIIAKNKDFDVPDWRREELLKMAEVCWHVPAKPVRGFWDAMQCKWFVYVMNHSFERYASGFAHKADDLLWPYYRRSVIEKDCQPMTREECVELVEEERLKISERGIAKGRAYRTGQPGANDLHILTIGGTDAQGRDLSNEVTKLYLEAALNVTTPEPSIMLRWHSGLDPEVKRLTFECIRRGFGFPSIKNDALNKWQLEYYFDATHEEASSWAVQLCMSPGITGRRETQKSRSDGGGELLQTKCLEMTFTDGFDYTFSNAQAGPHTGTPDNSWTIDDVWDAYRKQVAYAINHLQKNKDVTRWVEARWLESPLLSLIDDACMEKGVGALADRSRSNPWMNTLSLSDHADSFAAMEKLIFDEKKYTMDELVKALRANWEGYDEMRRDFIACPKWGNDDDYVDKWGERILHMYFEEMHKNVNYNGKRPLPLPQTVALFSSLAPQTGPIPSGRRHGEVLGSGGIDPYMGMDKKGPTAVLKSVAKANHREMKGCQFNQRLSHELMRGEKGFALWSAYMDAWNELDADHVQFNVFKTEDLRDAQKEPEKYPDLLVRVAGYSVRFTSLAKLTQDAIIARNEQQLG